MCLSYFGSSKFHCSILVRSLAQEEDEAEGAAMLSVDDRCSMSPVLVLPLGQVWRKKYPPRCNAAAAVVLNAAAARINLPPVAAALDMGEESGRTLPRSCSTDITQEQVSGNQ